METLDPANSSRHWEELGELGCALPLDKPLTSQRETEKAERVRRSHSENTERRQDWEKVSGDGKRSEGRRQENAKANEQSQRAVERRPKGQQQQEGEQCGKRTRKRAECEEDPDREKPLNTASTSTLTRRKKPLH